MTTLPYDDRAAGYAETPSGGADRRVAVDRSERAPIGPGVIFLWIAWAIAAVFWLASLQIDVGIIEAVQRPVASTAAAADVGGIGFAMMTILGVVALGIALAYGLARTATRNRALDPVTEAATASLYDQVERQGGEDKTVRSPDERAPQERDAYQGARHPAD
jgi:hypothetical protein